jgi:restriction system protein
MALWVINVGVEDELARRMLESGVVGIGWPELPDLASLQDREALVAQYRRCFPEVRGARLVRDVGQILAFAHHAKRGDLVALPRRAATPVAIGEIAGGYVHREDLGARLVHTRAVHWLTEGLPLARLGGALRSALDTPLAFCRVQRRRIEGAVRAAVEQEDAEQRMEAALPLDALVKERILERVEERYAREDRFSLVETILELRGLVRKRSPGAEAAAEARFTSVENPASVRLLLGMTSSPGPLPREDLARFLTRVRSCPAEQGMLVAWDGTSDEARELLAEVRGTVQVWAREDVLEALLNCYERLPEAVQAEIPLKRAWILDSSAPGRHDRRAP